jgi:hypothetical protein
MQWFDLIYYDKPVDYESLRIKIEKQQEKERSKLPDQTARQAGFFLYSQIKKKRDHENSF